MRTFLAFLYLVLYLILTIPLMIAEWIIGKFNPDLKDRSSLAIVQWGFRCILWICGTKITTIGKENIPKDQAVLYVANHRSIFDIVLCYSQVPGLTGFLAKKELKKVPLLNFWIANVHTLFLDRQNIKEGMKTILTAIDLCKNGISIFVFPEGTRNKTEDPLLPFHDGSFKIATKAGCPILPVTINHSREIFENQFPWVKKTHVIIEYGKPIPTAELSNEEKRSVSKMAADVIAETYVKNEQLVINA
ncbi:MAG: 1-acyl-sn-glycerol-3-phosphate acyltransferase [Lachnospiraceae bacterium]|nr:1-acyl-sn-glycerol-3-phosphate acyltransferase [Lachnospiraceae bacterium]